jgi:hypothetical protein
MSFCGILYCCRRHDRIRSETLAELLKHPNRLVRICASQCAAFPPKGPAFYLISVENEEMGFTAMPHLPDKTTTNPRRSPCRGSLDPVIAGVHATALLDLPTSSPCPVARTASTAGADAAWSGASSRNVSMAWPVNMTATRRRDFNME